MKAVHAIAVLLFVSAPCAAAEVDFSTVLTDYDGTTKLQDCAEWSKAATPVCEKLVDMTLARLSIMALGVPEQNLDPVKQVHRGILQRQIFRRPKLELDAADTELIKSQIGKLNIKPSAVLSAFELLDPASVKK